MDRTTELSLLKDVIGLMESRSFHLDDVQTGNDAAAYCAPERFLRERRGILRKVPLMAAHVSELAGDDAFLRRQVAGLPLLFTRDGAGMYHAFLNVCRHRGTRLVDADTGCARRFTCPYHAWTWNNHGALVGVPHEGAGFPDIDRQRYSLTELSCVERHGWLWVSPQEGDGPDTDAFLTGLGAELDWIGGPGLRVAAETVETRDVNWKTLVEGGLESYHFKVAHRATIGPYFHDNLSTYQTFGDHIRSVLPRVSLKAMATEPEDSWKIREHVNLLYTVFPLNQLLVQQDHTVWVQLEPLGPARTRIALRTMAPEGEQSATHWERNHRITCTTLAEDFTIGESIQSGLESGANEFLTFGRFEGALHHFNESIAQALRSAGPE